MKKKWFQVGILFLLIPLMTIGCGVAQEQYDTVVSDLSKSQQDLQTVKAELETSRANVSDLTANQEKLNSELATTQTKLSETSAEIERTKELLETTIAELEAKQDKLEEAQKELPAFKEDLLTQYGPLFGLLGLNDALSALTRAVLLNEKEEIPALAATVSARIVPSDI